LDGGFWGVGRGPDPGAPHLLDHPQRNNSQPSALLASALHRLDAANRTPTASLVNWSNVTDTIQDDGTDQNADGQSPTGQPVLPAAKTVDLTAENAKNSKISTAERTVITETKEQVPVRDSLESCPHQPGRKRGERSARRALDRIHYSGSATERKNENTIQNTATPCVVKNGGWWAVLVARPHTGVA